MSFNPIGRIFETIIDGIVYIIEIMLGILLVFLGMLSRFLKFISKFIPSVPPRIGTAVPKNTRQQWEDMMRYGGIEGETETFLGYVMTYCIVVALVFIIACSLLGLEVYITLLVGVLTFFFGLVMSYIATAIVVERRAKSVEDVLPDFLSLMSQNIAAGMTTYDAMKSSARPEFGPLSEEIYKVSRDMLSGVPMEAALLKMTNRIRSEKVDRVIRLVIGGLKSGGKLPRVLQEISRDLQREQGLLKRLVGETGAQSGFILIGVIFGAPLLFAVSIQFISLFSLISEEVYSAGFETSQAGVSSSISFISMGGMSVNINEFFNYAIMILFILSFFGAIVIGLLRSGKILTSSNIMLVPVLVILSIGVFLLLKHAISVIFQGMIIGSGGV
ncbi:MAG: hypothetical protein B6U72_05510 [Candidatus Altiarchaeales archaeon ex4484_2]|nr:MAG: hypothetical protein B6U72_05510 [Candidatus Altiarchaeales archaeon ex4484_2]